MQTMSAIAESRRFNAHERPWLPSPTTATDCPAIAAKSASFS